MTLADNLTKHLWPDQEQWAKEQGKEEKTQ
jgi:hypothetical protein